MVNNVEGAHRAGVIAAVEQERSFRESDERIITLFCSECGSAREMCSVARARRLIGVAISCPRCGRKAILASVESALSRQGTLPGIV